MNQRDTLRLLRSEIGMTQTELSRAMNVGYSAVNRWENKNIRPNKSASILLLNLAKQHHVSDVCLDSLTRLLFASRANDKKEKQLVEEVTDRLKLEQRVLLTDEQLHMALDNVDIGIIGQRFYSSDPQSIDIFYYNDFFVNLLGYDRDEFEQMSMHNPYFAIPTEHRSDLSVQFKALLCNKIPLKNFALNVEMIRKDGSRLWIEVKAISIKSFSLGQELFTACRDISDRVFVERKYKEELSLREVSLQGMYSSFQFDLTTNSVIRHRNAIGLIGHTYKGESAENIMSEIASSSPDGPDKNRFLEVFSCRKLMTSFGLNDKFGSIRLFNNRSRYWLRHYFLLLINPSNGHLLCLLYSYNCQESVLSEKMMSLIAHNVFDFVGCIDLKTGLLESSYITNESASPLAKELLSPSPIADELDTLESYDDLASFIASVQLDVICHYLNESKSYAVYVKIRGCDGGLRVKRLTFCYLDDYQTHLLVCQSDLEYLCHMIDRMKSEVTR